jgi:3-methyladenine DNA glycosylase Mpg
MGKFKLIEGSFEEIADQLLNKSYWRINGGAYRLVEIEFYLRSRGHNDMYVHADEEQKFSHKYYFHRFRNGSYKGGTFKGLDLVFGDEDTYFGILIRSILNLETDELVCGPCNVVNHVLKECGCDSIMELTGNKCLRIRKNKHGLVLRSRVLDEEKMYCGPRIGLSKGKKYWDSKYRYCVMKERMKKEKTKLEEV